MDQPFELKVEDLFHITGRGFVCTGRIASGRVRVGDKLVAQTSGGEQAVVVTGIETRSKLLQEAEAGMDVGLMLRGFKPEQLKDAGGVPAWQGAHPVEIVLRGAAAARGASAVSSSAGSIEQSIAKLKAGERKPWWKLW